MKDGGIRCFHVGPYTEHYIKDSFMIKLEVTLVLAALIDIRDIFSNKGCIDTVLGECPIGLYYEEFILQTKVLLRIISRGYQNDSYHFLLVETYQKDQT
ncbi:Hypothetical predicted protein [Octopus vulgaris]|uniref:Uncharacterized protein n=1 Tax=Octopus vulgaris TaxID=6645 RepID=A0AA36FAL7_OCTVU|nr:Hypothetical predicted protein [Octopus vulgaris]